MMAVCCEYCLGKTAANKLYETFRGGCISISHLPIPGEANNLISNEFIVTFEEMIRDNRRNMTRDICKAVCISKVWVQSFFHQHLLHRKVSALQIPNHLIPAHNT
ncbi:hypothetical protein NPIL_100961 [Nephila pilipes]|uniref:Uncharacterized protein n=1 Tax=Nephila pilipes TaxID=299642 RepID=A0A8X6NCK6_NEPPI|nr:hypothetical protein NPIL_100961 [Nephila pilipes]